MHQRQQLFNVERTANEGVSKDCSLGGNNVFNS